MSNIKFILIEDHPGTIESYRTFLVKGGIAPEDIWPSARETPKLQEAQWLNAMQTIDSLARSGFDPRNSMVILILDLALNNHEGVAHGVEEVRNNQPFLDPYVRMVISSSADSVEGSLKGMVDGLLAKHELRDDCTEYSERFGQFRFWNAVRAAAASWADRTGRISTLPPPPPIQVIAEEVALRLFQSRFGQRAIEEVAEYVSYKYEVAAAPRIEIADGGFSGAAVLLVYFNTKIGKRSLALKVSESRERLDEEARASLRAVEASGKFESAILGGLSSPERLRLGGREAYCTRQVMVDGMTLDAALLVSDKKNYDRLRKGLSGFMRAVSDAGIRDSHQGDLRLSLALKPMQIARFHRSVEELRVLDGVVASSYRRRPLLSSPLSQPAAQDRFKTLADNWGDICTAHFKDGVICYEQHGDLHGRNVMIARGGAASGSRPGAFKLIDAARFGAWPAFYDISRLQLNLAVRLLDPPATALHHLPERVSVWEAHWAAAIAGADPHLPTSIVDAEPAQRFRQLFADLTKVADSHSKEVGGKAQLLKLMALNRCFDLIKMVAYVDLPAVRRLWLLRLLNETAVSVVDRL
jgi:hypothetical protein